MRNLRNANQPPDSDLVQVYLRSSWDIVRAVYKQLGNIEAVADAILAGDLADFLDETDIDTIAKLNAILTDATLGDFASQAEAESGTSNVKTMTPLRVAQAIAVLASGLLNKYDGTTAPGASDDDTAGYSVGSYWIDIVADPDESYRCTDNSTGAAVWIKTTLTSDELATVALTGDSDDLVEGAVQLLLTVNERSRLAAMEDESTADMTGAEIKTAYELEANTNAFTDAEKSLLGTVETDAKDDQTNAEIKTGYQAAVPLISQGDAEAGSATGIESWSAERVAQAIAALAAAGGGDLLDDLTPQLGGDLHINGFVIRAIGGSESLIFDSDTSAQFKFGGTTYVVMSSSGMYPASDGVIDLGVNNVRWKTIYANNISINEHIYWSNAYVIGGLPNPNVERILASVNDALAPVNGSAVVAGGAVDCLVWSDGTDWIVVAGGTTAAGGGGGGLTPVFKTASFTAVAGEKYFVDSSGGAVVVTLPAGADEENIKILDVGHAAGTYNITINPDGAETIDNDTEFVIDQNEGDVDIAFNGTNWEVSSDGTPTLINVPIAGPVKVRTVRTVIEKIINSIADEFDFNNIPSGYDRLIIKGTMRSNGSGVDDTFEIFLNEDLTPGNYHSQHDHSANGIDYSTEAPTSAIIFGGGDSSPATAHSAVTIEIENPDSSNNKLILSAYGSEQTVDNLRCGNATVTSIITAAIVRIRLRTDNDPTDQFTGTLTLYGEKDEEIGGGNQFEEINAQTGTTYEFTANDFVDGVTAENASASTYDVPDTLGRPGNVITLLNKGAGEVTITVAGSDTLGSSDNKCATGKAVSILKTDTTEWWVIGGSA